MLDTNQQWQAQRIIGERQTPSGLEDQSVRREMIRIITDICGLAATADDIVYLDSNVRAHSIIIFASFAQKVDAVAQNKKTDGPICGRIFERRQKRIDVDSNNS